MEIGRNIQYDILILEFGINADLGISNLTENNGDIPAKLNTSRSMDIGLFVKFGFQ